MRGRLHVVHESAGRLRARCPSHNSHSGTLAIREASDGTVLLRCHAGCAPAAVVRAIGLELRDLFPSREAWRRQQDRLAAERQRFRSNPRDTVRAALRDELARVRAEPAIPRPLRSAEVNAVRMNVARIYGIPLAPITPFRWECPPHDDDPAWKPLFEHHLHRLLIEKHGDPDLDPTTDEIDAAACRAAADLHDLARHTP